MYPLCTNMRMEMILAMQECTETNNIISLKTEPTVLQTLNKPTIRATHVAAHHNSETTQIHKSSMHLRTQVHPPVVAH